MIFLTLFVCLFALTFSAPIDKKPIPKGCRQSIVGDLSNPQMEVIEVPANCSRGMVNFHYTSSPLDIVFRKQGIYIVCISSKAMSGYEHYSIEDRTENRREFLGAPSKQRQVCTFTTNGNLNIRIEPKNLSYMLQVPYVLIDFNFPLRPISSRTDSKNV